MFEDMWKVRNPGKKYKKNSIYEMQNIKLIKIDNIPEGLREDRYSELVDANFVGKLVIVYAKDNVGRSGGSAQWCYVYDCNNGIIKYMGTAIHKCVDLDNENENYNEKLYSILGNLIFNPNYIRVPNIDLVKNIGWAEDKPAVLSYNITQREEGTGQDIEEMNLMKTIAFNKLERQEIHDNRISINIILESVEIQVMKKVGYEKKKAKEKIEDAIITLKLEKNKENVDLDELTKKEQLLCIIKGKIDTINEKTSLDSLIEEIRLEFGIDVTHEELLDLNIRDTNIVQLLDDIKNVLVEKKQNYCELEKSIVQTVVIDVICNNLDRHLANWALIRNKKTDRYILGLFDHATSFYNMSTLKRTMAFPQSYMREFWVSSSVLLDERDDLKRLSSRGFDVFKYLFNNYTDYTIEILQKLYEILPEFEKKIGYETIPNEEYMKLPKSESQKYYEKESDIVVSSKSIMEEFLLKYKKIEKEFGIKFSREQYEQVI